VKKLFVLVAAVALLLAASCDTKNIGTGLPLRGPQVSATFTAASTFNAGLTATLTVSWSGGTGPYTIGANMGGGTTANVAAGTPATSPFSQVFTLVEGGPFTWTATVTDANGNPGNATGTYTVGEALNAAPVITNVAVAGGQVTVSVTDADGDDVTVSVTEPAGLSAAATSVVVAGGNGDAVFNFSATDIIAGGSGTTDITADDGNGGTDTDSATITLAGIVIPDGALAAVPTATAASAGDDVTIVVISGDFSNPFQYMNGVGVTVDTGATYVDTTLNVGAPGGAQLEVDGIWTAVGPDSFLLPTDFMIQENDIGGGMVRIDFNVTPIGGSETSNGGALFNFGMNFASAGTYTLGFQEFQDVKRTYYSDGASTEYNWDDISNDYPDVPNSVDVT